MDINRIAAQPLRPLGLLLLAVESSGLYLRMAAQAACSRDGRRWRRLTILALLAPLFLVVQAANVVGLLLDELFVPAYRRQPVTAPLFVVGVPRSGTTMLHRTLAADHDTFSTPALWELMLAPSVLQKRLVGCWRRLDRLAGRPAGRLFAWLEARCAGRMRAIHTLGLDAPEEDFIWLLPVAACFGLIVLFPEAEALWRLARFDTAVPEPRRRRLMAFYRGCVQRHLYARGRGRRLISKNVSFTPWMKTLVEAFPDACLIGCTRPPEAVFPSQLSALRPAMAFCGNAVHDARFQSNILDMLKGYYAGLERLESLAPGRTMTFRMQDLQADLAGCVRLLYTRFGLPLPAAFEAQLAPAAEAARAWRSGHRYSLGEFGWEPRGVRCRIAGSLGGQVAS